MYGIIKFHITFVIMNLQSPEVTIEKSQLETYNFISDIKNFEQLMPENISKFEIKSEDTFLFALKGMPLPSR